MEWLMNGRGVEAGYVEDYFAREGERGMSGKRIEAVTIYFMAEKTGPDLIPLPVQREVVE